MEIETQLGAPVVGVEVSPTFDDFFRQHFARVAGTAGLVAGDAASGQDMAQEAFARLHLRWEQMRSVDHARNFAYRVAVNLARSHLRKHLRVTLVGLRHRDRPDPAGDPFERAAEWVGVVEALRSLTSRQRACVALVDYVDLDAAEAARILGIRTATVRVHLMRGRQALRERLEEQG